MRAGGADRKKFRPLSGYENCFAKGVPKQHSFIGHAVDLAALFEIRSLEFARFLSHGRSPSLRHIGIALKSHRARSGLIHSKSHAPVVPIQRDWIVRTTNR